MSTTPPADDDRTQYVPPPSPAAAAPPGPSAASTGSDTDFDPTMIAPPAARPDGAPAPAAAPRVAPPGVGAPTSSAPKPGASASSAGDSGNALPVGTYLSEFELTGVIGEGGFGIVYHAWDHSLQRKVALKEYMPASLASREGTSVAVRSMRHKETFDAGLKSFINEARLLAQFDHPSLVKVYRFWEANGTAYMVMPLYEGTTLKDKLRQMGGKPDEGWLMGILAPLTDALAVIHKENCFHRDIAPDNVILLAGSERPLLLDFGAARRVIGDMTQALTVILKPGYAPVEQYAESPDMKQGSWTDVYALAATVHWAIMGKTPPPSVSRLMNDSFQPLSKTAAGRYSERFLAAIDRALAVRPENRTTSIAALRADIGLDTPWATAMPGTAALLPQQGMGAPGAMPGTQFASAANVPTSMPQHGPGNYAPTQMASVPTGLAGMMAPPVAPERPDEVTMMAPRNASGGFEKTQLAMQTREAAESGMAPTSIPARTPAPPQQAAPAQGGGNKSMIWIGAAVALLAVGGIGAFMVMGQKAPPPAAAQAPAPAPAPTPQAAPAEPPKPAPAPTVAFSAREQMALAVDKQTPGFIVSAMPGKPQLSISKKDALKFKVTSARDGHVHVLLHGPDGSLTQLYPNDVVKDIRIKAGQTLDLPNAAWNQLISSDPVGAEQLLIIVSPAPREFTALGPQRIPMTEFVAFPTADQATAALSRWKRTTPILAGAPAAGCEGPSCDEYGAALFTVQVMP